MQSAQWERDRQVNSDSSGIVKRGRAKRDTECVCVREKDRQRERAEEKMRKIHLKSRVLGSCVKGGSVHETSRNFNLIGKQTCYKIQHMT